MKTLPLNRLVLAGTCVLLSLPALHAKVSVRIRPLFEPITVGPIGSITPPPKEWAMFPEEPPPAAPVQPPAGALPPSATPQTPGSPSAAAAQTATIGLVSAPVASRAAVRELPLGWLFLTGFLSLGAMFACGSLIVQKGASEHLSAAPNKIPVIADALEVR